MTIHYAPNYFAADPTNGTGEWDGEFWPGAGKCASKSAGFPGESFQVIWGDEVFRTGSGPITYTWNGKVHTNPGRRILPLVEAIDRPYLEYNIARLCQRGDWVVLDEEYIEPWFGEHPAAELVEQYKAKMTLLAWAKSYGHPRCMKFSHYSSGGIPATCWTGFYGQTFTDPGPGYKTDHQRFDAKPSVRYNYRRWCEAQDFYAPDLYMHDNTVEWWEMRLTAHKWYMAHLPRKPIIPMLSPQCWSPCPLPAAYPPAPPSGTPVDLNVLAVMIDDVNRQFNKAYWYIGASNHSWGDPHKGEGWWQKHPGTLPPQIELIKEKVK